jgi:hypothetical protein
MVTSFEMEPKCSFWRLCLLSSLLCMSVAACGETQVILPPIMPTYARTSTLIPSETVIAPIHTARSILTPSPTAEPVRLPYYFVEDFRDDLAGWSHFVVGNQETEDYKLYRERGRMIYMIDAVDTGVYQIYDEQSYSDVRVDVQAENVGTLSSVSILCGYLEGWGWMEYNITSQGLYSLRHVNKNGEISLLHEGASLSINLGEDMNDYTLICSASRSVSLFANTRQLYYRDSFDVPVGRVGVGVWAYDLHPVTVEVEEIEFSDPNIEEIIQ